MQPMITKLFVPHSVQEISDRKQIIVEKFQKAKLVGFRYFLPFVLSSLHIHGIGLDLFVSANGNPSVGIVGRLAALISTDWI